MNHDESRIIVAEFCAVVDAISGAYLDATLGMGTLAQQLSRDSQIIVASARHRAVKLPAEGVDFPVAYIGFAEGSEGPLHHTSSKNYSLRNAPGGRNWTLLAGLALVAIFQYWDDHFRQRLAASQGKSKGDLQVAAMGELRHFRRAIVHNASRAVPELERNVLLPRFARGEEILLDSEALQSIIFALKRAVEELVTGDASVTA